MKSDNVNISGFILKNGNFGIYLDYHDNHRITNNIVSGNINGIYLFLSNKNTITDNRVSNNKGHGIYLYSSYKNTITDNECSNNKDAIELLASNENTVANNNNISFHSDDGICIYESNSNEIINNDISNNAGMGIALSYSNDNSIYHNNLKDNDIQAIEVASTNLWDNDYPSGGNHWGDYGEKYKEEYNEDPEDKKCGQNQDQACDGDGIWDKPYKWIEGDAGAKDNYPLVEPWSNRVNAEFVTNGWPDCCSVSDETYKPGDIVRASCRVKNTGSAQARFVVVFNVRAPDGTIYSKTSRYETILPGRRHTFLADMDDLLLRIPVDANTGFYDVKLEVKGYDTGRIYDTWPSQGWKEDQFKIELISSKEMVITAFCPVDLSIIDPEGLTITKQLNEIPSASYIESDVNGDGDPDDIITIPDRKIGNYQIIVIPESDAEPTDRYTLKISIGDTTTVLAENVSVSEIPEEPYVFESKAPFDTGSPYNPYPSISGTHTGTITPGENITVHRLYTYPCEGTGGHTEYVRIYGNGIDKNASWSGYNGDWQYIYFDNPFVLEEGKTYNYTIMTGSYPQIIHETPFNATGGTITCTRFIDANGRTYTDWIPAIRLE